MAVGLSLLAVPALAETTKDEKKREDIVVTGIAADDSYAREQAAVAGKSPRH